MKAIDELRSMRGNYAMYEDLVTRCCEIADEIEHELEEEYVALPKDMNGERVHVGDTLHDHEDGHDFRVDGFELWGDVTEWWAFQSHAVQYPLKRCSLVKPPTVEDVLREFALACEDAGNAGPEVERIASEFAERLQLREEGE